MTVRLMAAGGAGSVWLDGAQLEDGPVPNRYNLLLNGAFIQGSNSLHFWYDASGRPALVEYNGTKYGYLHNLQGDIVGIVDSAGNEVVKYSYDAWGKPLGKTGSMANTLGTLNPFCYRGYVYDEETGLYYLRSRYYNPSWGRFINADVLIKGNLFSMCSNNPIVRKDADGFKWNSIDVDEWRKESFVVIELEFDNSVTESMRFFLNDPTAYGYKNRSYIRRKLTRNGKLTTGYIDCSHYLYEIHNGTGSKTARYRYLEAIDVKEKGKLKDKNGNLTVELQVGMEVFRYSNKLNYYSHCGEIVLHDFGNGLVWAVTESCRAVNPERKCALYYNDDGPNITSFYNFDGTFDWDGYVLHN